MEFYIQNKDLTTQFNTEGFVLKTQRQIIKDFGSSGINFNDNFESTLFTVEQIILLVSDKLKEVETISSNALPQLLYQIDIPESLLPELAKTEDFYTSLTEVILKREAYKVYLRSKFSS